MKAVTEILREPFEHDGAKFEVVVTQDSDGTYHVRAWRADGRPANPYAYTTDVFTNADFQREAVSGGKPAWRHLADAARADVEARRWERYVEAVRAAPTE